MEIDTDKIHKAVLALLYLTLPFAPNCLNHSWGVQVCSDDLEWRAANHLLGTVGANPSPAPTALHLAM